IVIIGAGGHAAELHDYIMSTQSHDVHGNSLRIIGFIDENVENYLKYELSSPYLGSISDHKIQDNTFYLIGIGNPVVRKNIVLNFKERGAKFISYVDPSASLSPTSQIGIGAVIAPFVNLGPKTVLGDFSLINSRCSLGHDSQVGEFNI